MIERVLGRLAACEDLTMEEMFQTVESIMLGRCTEVEIAQFLAGLRIKGETSAEIAGAAQAMRTHMTHIRTSRTDVIDTCGTGGDKSGTFNISTAAALVAAAAGVPVAKHGNRSFTSKSGSADVLAALGVNIAADVTCVEACLEQLGICFCFAPLLHESMKYVTNVRRKLGIPTIFNMLGPLSNPAGARFQLVGVGWPEMRHSMAEALLKLNTQRAVVVCGEDGLDEVTLAGLTQVTEVKDGAIVEHRWTPADFGVQQAALDSIKVQSVDHSAQIIRDVLAGKQGEARDIVVINAAAALWTAGKVDTPLAGAFQAAEAIDSGAARKLLAKLVDMTNRAFTSAA